jgi:hypothetical protein
MNTFHFTKCSCIHFALQGQILTSESWLANVIAFPDGISSFLDFIDILILRWIF